VGSLVFFGIIYFMLTRPVVRLAAALNHARDGKPIPQRKVAIRELQMLQDAALALGEAHRELETVRGQLELQAHTDALTDLANRRMFELQGQQAFFHAQRYGEAMSVIVLDIDHFKRINDQFGHEGGDVVLRALGRYLKEAVRASERPAARIGGEEFAILVSHSTEEEPLLFA
jgi:GGDEF domain-containing protein